MLIGFFGLSYAMPEPERERTYEKADFVFYGEVLSLDILSEPVPDMQNNNYSELAGKAIYSIKIHSFIKNSFDDEIISAYGFYHLQDNPSGTSFTPGLYKIGDKMEFYVKIFNENESSYEYLIDHAEIVEDKWDDSSEEMKRQDYAGEYGLTDPCDSSVGPGPPSRCYNDPSVYFLVISLICAGLVGGFFIYSKKRSKNSKS